MNTYILTALCKNENLCLNILIYRRKKDKAAWKLLESEVLSHSYTFLLTSPHPHNWAVPLKIEQPVVNIYLGSKTQEDYFQQKETLKFCVQIIHKNVGNKMNPTLTLFLFIRNPAKRIMRIMNTSTKFFYKATVKNAIFTCFSFENVASILLCQCHWFSKPSPILHQKYYSINAATFLII